MKRFKKEILLFTVVFVVAIAGLLQLFHEEAYAIQGCNLGNCYCNGSWCGGPELRHAPDPTSRCIVEASDPNCFSPGQIVLCDDWCCVSC